MASTLTIVGCNPAGHRTDVFDAEKDTYFASVLTVLKAATSPAGSAHGVDRAASVDDIVTAIENHRAKFKEDPTVVQIIAHGRSGHLHLAESGDQVWPSPPPNALGRVLSRRTYHTLREVVPAATAIYLLGCSVGAPTAKAADDGPILAFTLSHMLQCDVFAIVDAFNAGDLDAATGVYRPDQVSRLTSVKRDVLALGVPAPMPPPPPAPVAPLPISFTTLRLARGLDELVPVRLSLRTGLAATVAARLASGVLKRQIPVPLSAMPDYEFDARLDGQSWRACVVNNGRALRLSRRGSPPRCYPMIPGTGSEGVLTDLATLAVASGAIA